jgi:hypothetical protein
MGETDGTTDADALYKLLEATFAGAWHLGGNITTLLSCTCRLLLQLDHCYLAQAATLPQLYIIVTLHTYRCLFLPCLPSPVAGAWSLLDVCCMCASSKLLCSSWLQLLKQQPSPAWLVAAAADAAHASTPYLQAKDTKVMHWLLKRLPEARLAEQPSALAGLPCMPMTLAVELCGVGVRVPYADVAAAARRRVAGET